MKIVIIGAGAIGNAIAKILKENRNNSVALWDAVPGKVSRQLSLDKTVPKADAVFFCLPTFGVRDAVESVRPFLSKSTSVICMSKGIEAGTNLTMDRLLAKVLPRRQPFAILFGPMLASELDMGVCGHAVSAGDSRARNLLWKMFSGTRLSVVKSMDLRGVALAGALKNVYAIGLGILSALKAGDNMRGAYVVSALDEMGRIIVALGGRKETAEGFAGLGDLVATGLNATSRNWQIGCALVEKPGQCQGSEGARAASSLASLLGKRAVRFPIFFSVYQVLSRSASPSSLIAAVCSWRP
jgi:glycerol-3-phosphate dehydrogenase (NAD(P)+)